MIAFEVYVNGEKLCTAGIGDLGVLSAILSWTRVLTESNKPEESLDLAISGLDSSTERYPKWLRKPVAVGDAIRIQIVNSDLVDLPIREDTHVEVDHEDNAKKYVRSMAKEWGWKLRE